MTPGDFEVENAALTPDRREVIFNSNQDDIDRRHLWREAAGATQPIAGDERARDRMGARGH